MKVFSLFSGIGAFEYALHKVWKKDVKTIWFSEIDKFAKMVYKYKYGVNIHDYGNILNIEPKMIPDFDILVWWPPCQPYSSIWKRLWAADPRWEPLVMKYIEILKVKRPKVFVFENVKWLLDNKFKDYFEQILLLMEELGYTLEYKLLNTADYWIPQRRKRIFIIWYLSNEYQWILNLPKKKLNKSFSDILLDIQNIEDKYIYTKNPLDFMIRDVKFKDSIRKRIDMWTAFDTDIKLSPTLTANLSHWYPTNFLIDRRYINNNYCKFWFNNCQFMWQEDVCNWCDNGCNYQEIYPIGAIIPMVRKIHPIEAERLQWMVDNYTKYGINEKGEIKEISDTQRYRQIWNSISINVLELILKNIKKSNLIK